MASIRRKIRSVEVSATQRTIERVLYRPDLFQKGQHVELQDAFARWYSDRAQTDDFRRRFTFRDAHSLNPRVFTEFLQEIRLQFCEACPESLVEQATVTFGGADGGGGLVYTGVEAG